jgi:hypothetical protein
MGVQKHYKKRFTKTNRRNVFTKTSTKNPKPIFSRFCFITFLGVSQWGELKKHDKKISHKNLTSPGTFLASEEPTNHPKVRKLFLSAPWIGGGVLGGSWVSYHSWTKCGDWLGHIDSTSRRGVLKKKVTQASKYFFWRLRKNFCEFFYHVFALPLLRNAQKRDKQNRAKQPR